jgi:MraZ protein
MFLGEFNYTLDSKSRLTIPAKFRELLAPTLVVTRNPTETCLMVLPMQTWSVLAAKLNALPMADANSALLRRIVFSAAEDLRADAQGRILLSQRLRDFAGIQDDVLIAGVNSHLELWNPQQWEDKVMARVVNPEVNSEVFRALGI